MRILAFQFVAAVHGRPTPRFEPQLGVLLALLKARGHDVALVGVSRPDPAPIKAALARHLPQILYADISAVCIDVARRALQYLQDKEFLPVVAGGTYATVDPAGCLSLPGVAAGAGGEPDASLGGYFGRLKDPAGRQVVQGVWWRDESRLAQPQMPALVEDLDSLPFAERDAFEYSGWVRQTGELEIAAGRGCPQACGYCLLPATARLYEGRGAWVRRRSPENLLEEIGGLQARFAGAQSVRILDHAFALDGAWLESFLSAYERDCGLPLRCHLRANAADAAIVARLAAAGCRFADVEVISGSDFIRNEIFEMALSEEQLTSTFAWARRAGIRTRAVLYLGAPYESEVSLEDTGRLLRALHPDVVDVRPYYPWPGTVGRRTAADNGWLHSRGEEQHHADQPGIDMPACRPDLVARFIRRYRQEFGATVGEPWWRRWWRSRG